MPDSSSERVSGKCRSYEAENSNFCATKGVETRSNRQLNKIEQNSSINRHSYINRLDLINHPKLFEGVNKYVDYHTSLILESLWHHLPYPYQTNVIKSLRNFKKIQQKYKVLRIMKQGNSEILYFFKIKFSSEDSKRPGLRRNLEKLQAEK